jgi:hypothetical protein
VLTRCCRCMEQDRIALTAAFKRRLIWIAAAAVVVAVLALGGIALTGPVSFHLGFAVVLGVFFSFALGGGLFAASFYSARSGFDRDAAWTDGAANQRDDGIDRH